MAIIIQKMRKHSNIDFIIIPNWVFNNFISKHVYRNGKWGKSFENTCIVDVSQLDEDRIPIGIPNTEDVANCLVESINSVKIMDTRVDIIFPINRNKFRNLFGRIFKNENCPEPIGEIFYFRFLITLEEKNLSNIAKELKSEWTNKQELNNILNKINVNSSVIEAKKSEIIALENGIEKIKGIVKLNEELILEANKQRKDLAESTRTEDKIERNKLLKETSELQKEINDINDKIKEKENKKEELNNEINTSKFNRIFLCKHIHIQNIN